jgi:glycosyltransferase involved in cell wall biosynthesis
MKIGLNATCLTTQSSGATQRFKGLYREVFKRLPNAEFVVYEPVDCRVRDWFNGVANVTYVRSPLRSENRIQRQARGLRFWSHEAKRNKLELFESFNLPIVAAGAQNLLTVHDIRYLKLKTSYLTKSVYRFVLADSIQRAQRIITVSEAARGELLEYFPSASVSVVYNGIDTHSFSSVREEEVASLKARLNLPSEFILSVGHFEARKNYLTLIDAMSQLRSSGCDVNLVIVGNDSGGLQDLIRHAASKKLMDRLHIFTQLPDSDVRCIYRLAMLLAFPSMYEGFGIPILEGMASKVPVVLSDIPIFREVTEGMTVYFDPSNPESIADSLSKVLSSSSERERLVQYGIRRIGDFEFSHLAAKVESIYVELS